MAMSHRSALLPLCLATALATGCVGKDAEADDGVGDLDDDDDVGGGEDDAPGAPTPMAGGSTPKPTPGTGGTTGGTTGTTTARLLGDWAYVTAFFPRPDGTMATQSIGGDFTLRRDMTWTHYRRIGSVVANGKGTYTVRGDVLTLKHDDGASKDLVYKFVLGTHTDERGTFRALTLNFSDGWAYMLVAPLE
jgi:hypothetical protein